MPFLPHLSFHSWVLVLLSGIAIGLSKSGLSGVNMVGVILFASVFPARESTGMLLLPLIVGDLCSVILFNRQADWKQLQRVFFAAVAGVILGWASLQTMNNRHLRPTIGGIIIVLTFVQFFRHRLGNLIEKSYHGPAFAWTMGGLAGWTTMLANAAGPVMSLFFLSMQLSKLVFVGTSAWFFLGINLFKVPFSLNLGLIHWTSLGLAICLSPIIFLSVLGGRWLLLRISQKLFEAMILVFAVLGALKLIFF